MKSRENESVSHSVESDSLQPHRRWPTRHLCPWIPQTRILEWVSISFSRRSSWFRDQTQISSIEGKFFTIWATREAHEMKAPSLWPRLTLITSLLQIQHQWRLKYQHMYLPVHKYSVHEIYKQDPLKLNGKVYFSYPVTAIIIWSMRCSLAFKHLPVATNILPRTSHWYIFYSISY